MSKMFVHTHAAIVVNNKLINAFDLRRRDVSESVAFAYQMKKQRAYTSVIAKDDALDVTYFHDESLNVYTRLQVFDLTCCERCAVKRGAQHESYCDVSKQESKSAGDDKSATKKVNALDLLETLKLSSASASNVKLSDADKLKQALAELETLKSAQKSPAGAQSPDDDDDDDDDDDAQEQAHAKANVDLASSLAQELAQAQAQKLIDAQKSPAGAQKSPGTSKSK